MLQVQGPVNVTGFEMEIRVSDRRLLNDVDEENSMCATPQEAGMAY